MKNLICAGNGGDKLTEKIIDKLKELVFYGIILCIFIVVITGKTSDHRVDSAAQECITTTN